ncbi:hypothetical protein LCGC14_2257050 [marine sediment metagenome]|uniref:Uncharacterized protein n=1 Tax=marine sediment metagenome TaxID=412755 RepID=A0A0F9DNC4_9ZZZZ
MIDNKRLLQRAARIQGRNAAHAQEEYAAKQQRSRRMLVFEQPKSVLDRVQHNNLVCTHIIALWRPCTKCKRTRENAVKQSAKLLQKLGMTL